MKSFKIDEKEEERTKDLLSKEDLKTTQRKMIKIFIAFSFVLGLLILGLYFVV